MKLEPFAPRSAALLACLLLLPVTVTPRAAAQSAAATPAYGPYNVHSIAGGIGVTKQLAPHDPLALSGSGWSLTLWVRPDAAGQTTLLAGVGQPLETFPRFLGLRDGKPIFWAGDEHILETSTALAPDTWHSLAVFADGPDTHLLVDGADVAHASLPIGPSTPELQIAPIVTPTSDFHHFSGLLAIVSLARGLSPEERQSLAHAPANLDNLAFDDASKPWPVQTRQWIGYRSPQ
ncbi:MAG TPA: LamG-like jellyroll fold domain-containing protein, partial [Acidobacteriaceae bacterium]|nr:LamG-like jellyroll fold domain-containing protein [Acidobacteriaceae bacterium]